MNERLIVVLAAALAVIAGFAFQQRTIKELREEVTTLRAEIAGVSTPGNTLSTATNSSRPARLSGDITLARRLSTLEQTVSQLSKASEQLMARGALPPSSDVINASQIKFLDVTAPDRDRLQALRLLRRNNGLTDDLIQNAVGWLQSSTNARTRRDLLQQLNGITNAILKEPLLNLATTDTSADVREEAIDNLRRFVNDTEVEQKLWQLLQNDPSEEVREQAEEALREGPVSETRLAALRQRAISPESTLEERLVAMRAMRNARVEAPEISAFMAQLAQNTHDPVQRAKIFRAFDGTSDPALKVPLVYGLQDPNPIVRQEAADALSKFTGDPTIQEWLKYVGQNDADPRVRREAFQSLERSRN